MADDTMVQFRTCLSTEVSNKSIIEGSIILCSDSGEFFYDDLEGNRISIAKAIEYLNTDTDRTGLLTPESEILYVVKSTGMVWIYNSGWICLNTKTTTYFTLTNIEVPTGTVGVTVSDSRITSTCAANFYPIPALYDLATASTVTNTCTCNNGSVTIITTCSYPLIGSVEIIKP